MKLYPAIDLKNGKAVRLFKGRFDEITVYDDNPVNRARSFSDWGFEYLHCVDLDGALSGHSVNVDVIKDIRANIDLPIQLGGGIRNIESIENWLTAGVSRVILGTIAARNPEFVREAATKFPGHIAVGIDAIDGKVAVSGWAEATNIDAQELAKRFEGAGVSAIIATDINRDGTKTGINLEYTQTMANCVSIPIIASGGLKGVEDIIAMKKLAITPGNRAIHGAIMGKALYDGLIDPKEALGAAA